jgi:hypothetical protein
VWSVVAFGMLSTKTVLRVSRPTSSAARRRPAITATASGAPTVAARTCE